MAGDVVATVYGPMSAKLAKSSLADLCLPNVGIQTGPFGSQLHASDYVGEGTPIITVEHLGENRIIHSNLPRITDEDKERLSRYKLITGDIVFSRVGSVDRRAIVHPEENDWLLSGRCLRVRPDRKKIDPSFLSWFFGLPTFQEHIRQIAVGATMPSLNTKILGDVTIFYPPSLKEQQAIACILGALDDKIELNRKMNRTLEAMAQAIFKSWFVDFDPVRAKHALSKGEGAKGRPSASSGQALPGLPKKIADLFPDSFEDSELGAIPEGWQVKSFTDTIEIIGGGTPKTTIPEYWDGDIPWFSVVDAPGDSEIWVIDTKKKITQEGVRKSSTQILSIGTTIISARGTVGRVALVGIPMAMNQSCYGLQGKADKYGSFTYFVTRALVANLQQHAHGSVFDTITRDTLRGVSVVEPPTDLTQAFEIHVNPIMERVRMALLESRTLATLRDSLLLKLISGELRVSAIEEAMDPASSNKANNYHKKQGLI